MANAIGRNEGIALQREAARLRSSRDSGSPMFDQAAGRRLDEIERMIGVPVPAGLDGVSCAQF